MKIGKNVYTLLIYGGLGSLAYFVIDYFVNKSNAENAKATAIKENTSPVDKSKITITSEQAKAYCSRVITDCQLFKDDYEVYQALNELSDSNLVFISNVWAVSFADVNDNESLANYINDNKFILSESMTTLIQRLRIVTK